jgi:mannose/fructose/N-acetylgalactosamine-specific phosphotransferase system component IID
MNFETIVVGIVALLYASVGTSYALKGNAPWAIVWFSYSSANFGLIYLALKK